MRVAVPKETAPGERRVALVPETVSKLRDAGFEVRVERGAGAAAGFPDDDVRRGRRRARRRRPLLAGRATAVVVRRVARPPSSSRRLAPGTVVIGFLEPLTDTAGIARLRERGVVAFAMESIPRITRAQSMDALSSQATVAGYKAVLLAADRVPRLFPMLMTAAGTIAPVRALVIGAGVAGLQAIATARRLGAVVSAFDVRPAVAGAGREPRRGVPRSRRPHGGDGRRLRDRAHARAAGAAAGGARGADPGLRRRRHDRRRPGPAGAEAHPASAVEHMRPGSVIVDLAAETGGNCEVTVPGEVVEHGGVTVIGTTQPPVDDGVPREPALLAQRRRAPRCISRPRASSRSTGTTRSRAARASRDRRRAA